MRRMTGGNPVIPIPHPSDEDLSPGSPGPSRMARPRQFTNRRMRTFIATPSARNVNNTEDPP